MFHQIRTQLTGLLLLSCLLLQTGVNLPGQQPKKDQGLKPGETNTPAAKAERVNTTLKPGDLAPDFSLPTVNGDKEVKLSSFQGKKPVVLVFGSFT